MPAVRGGPGGAIDETRQPVLVLPDMGSSRFLPVRGRVVVSLAVWREWRWPDSRESAVPQESTPPGEGGRLPERWPLGEEDRPGRGENGRGRNMPGVWKGELSGGGREPGHVRVPVLSLPV